MKRFIGLMFLVFAGVVGWRIIDGLSSDAISMGIGVLFGIVAGIPVALLMLTAYRRQEERRPLRSAMEYGADYPRYPPQPPVIVVTGNGVQPGQYPYAQAQLPEWSTPRPERRYRIVGEQEGWVEE